MQRLWFPPGSASYKKADEIVVQDASDSTPEDAIQQFSAMAKAGDRLRPHLQWQKSTLPAVICLLHQYNIEMNLRIKWGVKKYPVYSVPNQKYPIQTKQTPLTHWLATPKRKITKNYDTILTRNVATAVWRFIS